MINVGAETYTDSFIIVSLSIVKTDNIFLYIFSHMEEYINNIYYLFTIIFLANWQTP